MLINFTVENWMSFRDPTNFSMVASKEQQHGERLTKLPKFRMRTLPTAAIYGGNASGKTNFFKAISFAKQFIIRGSQQDALITVEPFKLDTASRQAPSRFSFEILVEEDIYELSFSLSATKVIEEKLVRILSTSEKVLYHRIAGNPDPKLHASVQSQRLKFAFEGTRDNQLFLTNSVSQKLDVFKKIYDWFTNTLVLVAPDSRFNAFEQFITEESPLYERMNAVLPKLDMGISQLGGEEISLDLLLIPDALKQDLKEKVTNEISVKINDKDEKIIVSRQDGELSVKKLYTYHIDSDGKKTRFEMKQESDGSKRIIDILPAFLELAETKASKVYIIDEIDRSLHSLLTQQLITVFLESCSDSTHKQMLFTTHDLMLMSQSLFRRDEMWITQRKQDGSSELISFAEYDDIRNDKDIRKSYLQGRMGGIPNIITDQIFNISNQGHKAG
ncbi:MAG: AAA family ATPase [Bacteroidales bacterium]|jgi:AAA15 family ATPase/GTPase|nr:AAA family ATPase [Bacteroidales bacterium]